MAKRIQDVFWTDEYADSYSLKNSTFDNELRKHKVFLVAWSVI